MRMMMSYADSDKTPVNYICMLKNRYLTDLLLYMVDRDYL